MEGKTPYLKRYCKEYYVQPCSDCGEELRVEKDNKDSVQCSICRSKSLHIKAKEAVNFMIGGKVIEVEIKENEWEIEFLKIQTTDGRIVKFEPSDYYEDRHIDWDECKAGEIDP